MAIQQRNASTLLGINRTNKQREASKKHSEFMKQLWQHSEYKEHQSKLLVSARQKRKNFIFTPEHKAKLSEAKKKNWQDPEYYPKQTLAIKKGHSSEQFRSKKGHSSEQFRSKMRRIMRNSNVGNTNPNWQGGISFEPYSPEFNDQLKEQIKKRDNYTCQHCRSTQNLCIHHINYNKKNNAPCNLITLCNRCNIKANTNRAYWQAYFIQKILASVPSNFENDLLSLNTISIPVIKNAEKP